MAARVGGDDRQHDEELLRLEVSRGKDTNHVSFTVREPLYYQCLRISANSGQLP